MENEAETDLTEMVKQALKWFFVGLALLELPFFFMIIFVSEKENRAMFIEGAIYFFGFCLFLLFVMLVFLYSRISVRQR